VTEDTPSRFPVTELSQFTQAEIRLVPACLRNLNYYPGGSGRPPVQSFDLLVSGQRAYLIPADLLAGDWGNIALQGSWGVLGSETPQYRKDLSGQVFLRGVATGGSIGVGQVLGQLPVNFRPTSTQRFLCVSNETQNAYVVILPTGNIEVHTGSNAWVDLSITFSTH
jgi:hypothetical protein